MIVATAGHVDHGKTLLVKALTGVVCRRKRNAASRLISVLPTAISVTVS